MTALLKKIDPDAELTLKGWILNALEDHDVLGSLKEALDAQVLEATGEAMGLLMEQDDTIFYLSVDEGRLAVTLVFPLGDPDECCGSVEWKLDFDKIARELIESPEDEEVEDLQKVRDALQSLVDAYTKAIEQAETIP